MTPLRMDFPRSLGVLLLWLLLTMGLGLALSGGGYQSIGQSVAGGIGLPWVVAAGFALVMAYAAGRAPMGLGPPAPGTVRLVWLPMLYVCLMLALDLVLGLPSRGILLIVVANTLLVGLSEELMFRSILFHGLLSRFRIWPAVLLTSFAFGIVHSLNVFSTGHLDEALMQSVAAFMQGLAYLAIRIRTHSVWPMVPVHGLWDCSLILSTLSRPASGESAAVNPLLSLLIALPIFLYGLFLLRHLGRDAAFMPGPET